MSKKWVQYNGKDWVEVSGGSGGGGSSHTHPNLSLLNSITSAMVSAWNTASTWVSTNGAAVLSHLSDAVSHITASERSAWNAKYDIPTGGTAGQVLKKTADGTAWANESGGGGGGGYYGVRYVGSWSVKTNTVAEITVDSSNTTALLFSGTTSSITYSELIPLDMLTESYVSYGISASNTNITIRLKKTGNTVYLTRSSTTAYTIKVYAV